jgi:hypothetical protein
MRDHTRLADRAAEWDGAGRTPERLLSGCDIAQAESWISARPDRAPEPTALQRLFIDASANAEREHLAERAARDAATRDIEIKKFQAEREAERLRLETAKLTAERATAIAESRHKASQLSLAASVATLIICSGAGWAWLDKTNSLHLAAEHASQMKDKELQLAWEKSASAEKDKRFAILQSEVDRNTMAAAVSSPAASARSVVTPGTRVLSSSDVSYAGMDSQAFLTLEELEKRLSKDAIDLMIAFEVGDRAAYERRFARPGWPSIQSGVVIGIGYDLGYVSAEQFDFDWHARIPPSDIANLKTVIGIRGIPAKDHAERLADITIPYEAALGEFKATTLRAYASTMEAAFPNAPELPPDSYGALVSLVFNRGAGMAGESRREMRAIRDLMQAKTYTAIPEQLRAMKRLSPEVDGLRKRRDAEATLFEKGLAERAVEQASVGARKL